MTPEARKPQTATARFILINLDPLDQHWKLRWINTSDVNMSCAPCEGDVKINDMIELDITMHHLVLSYVHQCTCKLRCN